MRCFRLFAPFLLTASWAATHAQSLQTRWAKEVTPENAHREYPRPQMVRPAWTNLNGHWDFAILPDSQKPTPLSFTRKILVPFPVESQLSGINQMVPDGSTLWYRRTFARPKGERILLHFGASDWETTVLVNGKQVGRHQGGFDPFTFDITDALNPSGSQELIVSVKDPTDAGPQPRGKQVRRPGGIFYRPTSGIWQTVWLEPVPMHSIAGLTIKPSIRGTVHVGIDTRTAPGAHERRSQFTVEILDGDRWIKQQALAGGTAVLRVPRPKLWSPDSPHLYQVRVKWGDDQVRSYFGFRDISLSQEEQPRIMLNGKPIYMFGTLDQGFWPDGLFTPPSDAAMKYDLEVTKRLGFNMIRKHVKVEPARWYYWCDKMGILVVQDMPSGDRHIGPSDPDITRTAESARIFNTELQAMVRSLRNHPSIVTWVLYNEGWGQWDTARMTDVLRGHDRSRLVISASGWADRNTGNVFDWHVYPGPGSPPPDPKRALFLGEFGGLGLVVPGHTWQKDGWGYQTYSSKEELTQAFESLLWNLRFHTGLSGAVYTQTTDVETELNGLMTYDRALLKMDEARVRAAIRKLYLPAPIVTEVVPTSEKRGVRWRFTVRQPEEGWQAAAYDDGGWSTGEGGFGTPDTPGAVVRTRWDTSDIWLRRKFSLTRDYRVGELLVRLSHDEDAEIYIDGKPVAKLTGYTTSYKLVPLHVGLTEGEHVLAIHCRQTRGGQYIDAGIVQVTER